MMLFEEKNPLFLLINSFNSIYCWLTTMLLVLLEMLVDEHTRERSLPAHTLYCTMERKK